MEDGESDRRVRELEAELAATRRLFRLDDVPTFTLDHHGTVLSTNGKWFGEDAPDCLGRPLWDQFAVDSRDTLERSAAAGWLGMSAMHLQLLDGRDVAVSVVESAPGTWLVAIRDIGRRVLLDEARDQRRQLNVLADFAGAIARELADPLTVVQARLELVDTLQPADSPLAKHTGVAYEHVRRLSASLRNLRRVGRAPAVRAEPVSVKEALEQASELLGPKNRERLLTEVDDDLTAGGDTAMVARVLASLVRAAMEGAGRSDVLLRARRGREGVIVTVGPVGRPRGEPDAARTGLAMESTLLHGGAGELLAWRRGNDRSFEARLPLAPQVPKAKRSVGQDVLLVGSPSFHDAVRHVLDMDGFEFHCVAAPSEAIDLLEGLPEIDMVGIDIVQPRHANGIEVGEGVLARFPELAGAVVIAGPRLEPRLGEGIVGVSWPIQRRQWLNVARRRARR